LYAGEALVYPNLGEPIRTSRDTALTFYVVVMPGPGALPQAMLEILRDGQVVAQGPTTLPTADASGRIEHVAQLPVGTLSSGRYTLRLTVSQGERREVREVAFELVD
jgi:hypothetical protein